MLLAEFGRPVWPETAPAVLSREREPGGERECRGRRERKEPRDARWQPAGVRFVIFFKTQNYQNAPRVFRPLNVRSGSYPGVPPVHELVSMSRTQWRTPFPQILFLK